MNIGVNLSSLVVGKIGGMEEVVRGLIHYFPKIDGGKNQYFLYLNETAFDNFIANERIHKIRVEYVNTPSFFKDSIAKNDISFWFSPLLVLDPIDVGIPSAIIIPDMQHNVHPDFFSKGVLEWRNENYLSSVEKADFVLTISEFSKKQIVDAYPEYSHKVKVFYPGVDDVFSKISTYADIEEARKRLNLPKEYIFYPANTWPHKNHLRLLEAFSRYIQHEKSDLHLVLTGSADNAHKDVMDAVKKLKLGNHIKYLGYVSKQDLVCVYGGAKFLIFPSLFEGFGIPPLEAMFVDCPVMCSEIASLPEVGGDAVLYFDPLNTEEIAEKISKMNDDVILRKNLIEKGRENSKKFSYKNAALEVLSYFDSTQIYENIDSKPLITIITPSYNQGQFIEDTIKSVVEQGYPNIEYIIVDGGSKDQSVEIIKKYAKKYSFIKWVSEKDNGQAHAINKGFQLASGDILAWLNSDDTYLPGTVDAIIDFFTENQNVDFVYGRAYYTDEFGKMLKEYPVQKVFDRDFLSRNCFICQPSAFWRKKVVLENGLLDTTLHCSMDYEYWIRISDKCHIEFIDRVLSTSRMYLDNKTLGQRENVYRDCFNVVKRHYGFVTFNWIVGYVDHKRNRSDGFFSNKPILRRHIAEAMVLYVIWNLGSPLHLLKVFFNVLRGRIL